MAKVAIAIDEWKLPHFEEELKKGKFKYTISDGLTRGTLMLKVVTTRMESLALHVKRVNDHCANVKKGFA